METDSANTNMPPSVLLIDDSIDVHRLLRARLRSEHMTLVSTTDALKGLEMARQAPPAAILLDLDMPDVDGFQVLRELKNGEQTNNVPVIVLSGLSKSEDKVAAFDLGANDYITKPCDLAELRARLRAALRLSRLLSLLAERANVDGLTGLGNRTAFDMRFAEAISESERYRQPLSLAILDLDSFKRINDTYGHPAGDEVLQEFALLLQRLCRAPDVPCRFGGEEFALIMPNTGARDALVLAERIRVEMSQVRWSRHPDAPVTVSIGIVGSDGAASAHGSHWIETADQNLYAAKRSGRNRTVATAMVPNVTLRHAG